MSDSKNNQEWGKLFKKYNILNVVEKEGFAEITAKAINEFREARLMTKFDHRSQLPQIFAQHDLAILPISRGSYVIGKFEIFHEFESLDIGATPIIPPIQLASLDYRNITSEATAVNCAFVFNILEKFTDEEKLFPTVSGRMSSSEFSFQVNAKKSTFFNVNVSNAQIEIDGGFEGEEALYIVEAKNYISNDFLIRQLYYPYRLWVNKIDKPVKTIFLTYSNGVFHLREFAFGALGHYNSVRMSKYVKYYIYDHSFNLEDLLQTVERTPVVPEPKVPFPQADSFDRVINLCELINQLGFISKDDITDNYNFDARQTDYYINAGLYLGLVDSVKHEERGCVLTERGKDMFKLNFHERQRAFVQSIVEHSVFRECLMLYIDNHGVLPKEEIVNVMKRHPIHEVKSEVTLRRRASTISSWINWIVSLVEA